MKTIFKYKLDSEGNVMLPKGAVIVKSRITNYEGALLTELWCEVNTEQILEQREFDIYGTGQDQDGHNLKHIETHLHAFYVWHLYEVLV